MKKGHRTKNFWSEGPSKQTITKRVWNVNEWILM